MRKDKLKTHKQAHISTTVQTAYMPPSTPQSLNVTNDVPRIKEYNEAIADKICALIATSLNGIHAICEAPDMPSALTVYLWLRSNEEFKAKYKLALVAHADLLIQEAISIACSPGNKSAGLVKIKVDALKWVAARIAPAKWGALAAVETPANRVTKKPEWLYAYNAVKKDHAEPQSQLP